jgi:phosphoserine aminotransferase
MLCVEDAVDGLKWAESIGGLRTLVARSQANLKVLEDWVSSSNWAAFLAEDKASRSSTSICLKLIDPAFTSQKPEEQAAHAKSLVSLLEKEGAAFDIGAYRDAPVGLRVWGGATVEKSDLEALLPWLDWAYGEIRSRF